MNREHMTASIRDVAAAAGVSVGTVSNVLNQPEKVAAATADRVLAAIADLGFVRNDAARQLRVGRSRSIGLVTLDIANPFFAEVARGAQERAADDGVSLLLGDSDGDPLREHSYLDLFLEQRVNGVLLTPTGESSAAIERLHAAGIPTVLVDAVMSDGGPQRVSSVSVDDVEGGFLAASHLLAMGRSRIAFAGGPTSISQVLDRLEGARRAVSSVPGASLEVIKLPALSILAGRAVGQSIAARGGQDRPDGIFCANDLIAIGVLQGLTSLGGLQVPSDIALIGYDDIDFAASTVVPLSSIRQPARAIGRVAVDLIFDTIANPAAAPRAVTFRPELVARASTGALR